MDSINEIKRTLRDQLRRDRELRFMPESWVHIVKAREFQESSIIASYYSYGFEPQTRDLNSELLRLGKTVLLPRTLSNNDIEWVVWDGASDSLKKNRKVLEPIGPRFEAEEEIEIVIVPALAIDPLGNRLGQGGGSYDRALSRVKAWKVGLVGAAELTHQLLPIESFDQGVNAAATPSILIRFNQDDRNRP